MSDPFTAADVEACAAFVAGWPQDAAELTTDELAQAECLRGVLLELGHPAGEMPARWFAEQLRGVELYEALVGRA